METINKYEITKDGFYGNFGGQLISDELKREYTKIAEEFLRIKDDADFVAEGTYIAVKKDAFETA